MEWNDNDMARKTARPRAWNEKEMVSDEPPTKRRVNHPDDNIRLVLDLRHRPVLDGDLMRTLEDHGAHRVFGHCSLSLLALDLRLFSYWRLEM